MCKPFKSEGFRPREDVGWGVIVAVGGIWVVVLVELGARAWVLVTSILVGVGSTVQAANRINDEENSNKKVEYEAVPLINEVI